MITSASLSSMLIVPCLVLTVVAAAGTPLQAASQIRSHRLKRNSELAGMLIDKKGSGLFFGKRAGTGLFFGKRSGKGLFFGKRVESPSLYFGRRAASGLFFGKRSPVQEHLSQVTVSQPDYVTALKVKAADQDSSRSLLKQPIDSWTDFDKQQLQHQQLVDELNNAMFEENENDIGEQQFMLQQLP